MAAHNAEPIRIVLVDDHEMVRAGLQMLIESKPGMKLVGMAGNRTDALNIIKREQPDIIILDLNLNGESGLSLIPQLLEKAQNARVLVLTGLHDLEVHRQSVRLGAMGLVLKDKAADVLLKAIERVHQGEVWFDRSLMGSVLNEISRKDGAGNINPDAAKIATLTAREREIITFVGEGLKNKQIAERAFISETTVRHHLTSIFGKLEVTDRLELIIFAYRHGLAEPPK